MKNIYIDVKDTEPGGEPVVTDEWVRPSDWLVLPTLVEGDQRVVGLHAVYGDSDFVSINCAGAYTVDWGDGTIQNVASNTKCDHKFDYSALAGTDCSRGYRQAIVTVIPQAGQLLTLVSFQKIYSQSGLSSYSGQWLDISIVGSSISSLSVGGSDVKQVMLEHFSYFGINAIINFSYLFFNCYSLRSIAPIYTSLGTNFSSMCSYNYSLKKFPLIDTSHGNDFSNMLSYCSSLQDVALINTENGLNFNSMFYNDYSLPSIPLLNTSKGTNFGNMVGYCYSLRSFPLLNTSLGNNFSSMFYNDYALQSTPMLNLSNGTVLGNIFWNCTSLQIALLIGVKNSISYSGCKLSSEQLVSIFQNLATVTGKTLTITGNWGTQYLTDTQKAIATNKGWTLVL